jgi:hypothetical protein
MKFNLMMMTTVSIVIKEMMSNEGNKLEKLIVTTPVHFRSHAATIEGCQLGNLSSSSKNTLPLVEEFSQYQNVQETLDVTSNPKDIWGVTMIVSLFPYLPLSIVKYLVNVSLKGRKMLFSNVKGFDSPLYFGKYKVLDISAFPPLVGDIALNMVVHTYLGQTKFTLTVTDDISISSEEFLTRFEDKLDELIN